MEVRAVPGRWQGLGQALPVLWGLYSGSGKFPYRVCVDVAAGSAKCSCPSRRFPCKHAIALQQLQPPDGEPPDWVHEWINRPQRKPLDDSPEAVERRAQVKRNRQQAMLGGVAGLTDWLADVAAAGIATLPGRDATWWQNITARMVDAQAPGLASALGELREIVTAAGPHWSIDVADRLGGLHLLTKVQPENRLGISIPEEQVKASPGWSDDWVPLLRLESDDGRVRTLRQWAWGRERAEWVVAVRHSAGGLPVPALPHGAQTRAVLHPYPGVPPHRVAVGELLDSRPPAPITAPGSWRAALAALEPLIIADPWQRLFPVGCASVRLADRHLVDCDRRGVAVRDDGGLDQALALTGGAPFDAWGLWNGRTLRLGAVSAPGGAPEVVG